MALMPAMSPSQVTELIRNAAETRRVAKYGSVLTTTTWGPGPISLFPTAAPVNSVFGNLPVAATFPQSTQLVVYGIGFFVAMNNGVGATGAQPAPADVQAIIGRTSMVLRISEKTYFDQAVWTAPGGGGVYGNVQLAAAAAHTFLTNGEPLAANYWRLDDPMTGDPGKLIRGQETVEFFLQTDAAVTLTATTRVFGIMFCNELRPVN